MKIEVTKSIDQNGKVIRAYVDYGDFCKMQSEYEAQIEKMKRCENCKHCGLFFDRDEEQFYPCKFFNDCLKYNKWELAE